MNQDVAVEIKGLAYSYGNAEAVRGFNLSVRKGSCHGLFGRNGAGKTTVMKCLLNLLRPKSGEVRVLGSNPAADEVAVKRRLAYVPDAVAFYPWMTVKQMLEYLASFRTAWNREIEAELLGRFRLDANQKTAGLSKGQRTQLALIGAICPEPELLLLDEPTSGLDPIVRREFIETVIGAYQDSAPGQRTILVSTHLISEFEGLIDDFTIMDQGRDVLTLEADKARAQYQRIRAEFPESIPALEFKNAIRVQRSGRELEVLVNGTAPQVLEELRKMGPTKIESEGLSLEELFVAVLK
jgi:ABC-2 type transport system ATP-binding protein